MVLCAVYACNHSYENKSGCSLFRFPANLRQKWWSLCRRMDRSLDINNDRICSCHFKDGVKDNGPSIFPWNSGKAFDFSSPEKKLRCKRSSPKEVVATATILDNADASSDNRPNITFNVVSERRKEHSYVHSCPAGTCTEQLASVAEAISRKEQEIRDLKCQLELLRLRKPRMTISAIENNEEKMLMYTSFKKEVFYILVQLLRRFQPLRYYSSTVTSISLEDQLLMTLMKLKLNCRDLDLAERFAVSRTTVSNVVKTHIVALHEILFDGMLVGRIPSQLKCSGCLPACFDAFKTARAVMDATEMTMDIPTNLNLQAACYSSYKSRHTAKAVTCVAPNGTIVFCSNTYPGSTSDNAIVEHSRILEQFQPGDLIVADKGFTIQPLLPDGVSLNIPPFLRGKAQFTTEEAQMCRKIARARIHVERANERIKNYSILSHIPQAYRPFIDKIFQLCCILVNFQAPLLKEVEKDNCETVIDSE